MNAQFNVDILLCAAITYVAPQNLLQASNIKKLARFQLIKKNECKCMHMRVCMFLVMHLYVNICIFVHEIDEYIYYRQL